MPQNSIFLGIGFCIGNLFWSLITALIASAVQSLKIQPWSLVLNGNAPCERKITFKTHVWSTYTKKKNSMKTVRVQLESGARQVCALSPLLFVTLTTSVKKLTYIVKNPSQNCLTPETMPIALHLSKNTQRWTIY